MLFILFRLSVTCKSYFSRLDLFAPSFEMLRFTFAVGVWTNSFSIPVSCLIFLDVANDCLEPDNDELTKSLILLSPFKINGASCGVPVWLSKKFLILFNSGYDIDVAVCNLLLRLYPSVFASAFLTLPKHITIKISSIGHVLAKLLRPKLFDKFSTPNSNMEKHACGKVALS